MEGVRASAARAWHADNLPTLPAEAPRSEFGSVITSSPSCATVRPTEDAAAPTQLAAPQDSIFLYAGRLWNRCVDKEWDAHASDAIQNDGFRHLFDV